MLDSNFNQYNISLVTMRPYNYIHFIEYTQQVMRWSLNRKSVKVPRPDGSDVMCAFCVEQEVLNQLHVTYKYQRP